MLDADIAKCFDRIDQKRLLEKLNTSPTLSRQIRAWLKAGVIDGGQLFKTIEGTPQGGVISPLLANIALHGMENMIEDVAGKSKKAREAITLVRYADDFVILHENLAMIEKCLSVITEWLSDMGLELKPEKTRVAHTLHSHKGEQPGFDFLGFNIRQYPVGKYKTGRNTQGKPLGFKTLIKPSEKAKSRQIQKLSAIVNAHKAAPQITLLNRLNPVIRGWANYYSTVSSAETYGKMDQYLWELLRLWAKRRHPDKSSAWRFKKYWQNPTGDRWVFGTLNDGENPRTLIGHHDTKIVRHIKVKGTSSPDDGNLTYWSTRLGRHPEIKAEVARLLKQQHGKCPHCSLMFRNDDTWEIDHIIPKALGGKDTRDNKQLLHKHCHDEKTAKDGSLCTKADCNRVSR